MRKKSFLAAALCAVAIAAVSAGSAFAGEIKGPGTPTGVLVADAVPTAAPEHTNSICAFSGLNHLHLDANGNFRQIGTATSDSSGLFSYQWTPDIPGKYTVYASFDGSNSYWPSHAETAFAVDSVAATPTSTAVPVQSAVDMDFVPAVAAIIVVIIIGFAVLALLMLRKRP